MAGVSATVSINDGLTRAFQRMAESINRTNQQLNATGSIINNINFNPIIDASNAQLNFNQNANNGASSARNLAGAIGGLVAGYVSLKSAMSVLKMSDEYIQTQARLSMVNDGLQTQSQLNNKIYNEAQKIGASYKDLASNVANLQLRAGDVFSSNDEALAFASNLNKLFNIAGASQQEVYSATLQLTQGLGSGVLRGEELNAVFEAAPNIIQKIADYMDVPIGQIRKMASEGMITADVVKASMLSATKDIDKQFNSMPFTSDNFWNRVKNSAQMAFSGIYDAINKALNGERMQGFINGMINSINTFAAIAIPVFNAVSAAIAFMYDNWSILGPLVVGLTAILATYGTVTLAVATYTRAAATATLLWNAAMNANPIVRVIMIVIAFITIVFAAIRAVIKFADANVSAWGVIVGAFMTAIAFVANLFLGFYNFLLGIVGFIVDIFADLGDFIGRVFNEPLKAAAKLFVDFAAGVLDVVGSVAKAIDVVFRTDYSADFHAKADNLRNFGQDKFGGVKRESFASKYQVDGFSYSGAYDYGYNLGDKIGDLSIPGMPKIGDYSDMGNSNFDLANMGNDAVLGALDKGNDSASKTAKNTKDAAKSTAQLADDLKYIRELQAQEAVNRYTSTTINFDMSKMSNNLSGATDIDGFVRTLTQEIEQSIMSIGSGE